MPGKSSVPSDHTTYKPEEGPTTRYEEPIEEVDPASQASELAFMKYGKPKRAPLIKGHAVSSILIFRRSGSTRLNISEKSTSKNSRSNKPNEHLAAI